MLCELSVSKLALIDSVHLHIEDGLTVFTGETGAGKSILLDAIGLLLGNRFSTDMIRKGATQAYVEALFVVHQQQITIHNLLEQWGMEVTDELLLSRQLQKNGRSTCRINGRIATVQMMKEIGSLLVQQHGQHEYQGLLRTEEQLRLLDLYGHHANQVTMVKEAYQAWNETKQHMMRARLDEQERILRMDMLKFQIEEISAANLQLNEEDELRMIRQRLHFAEKIASSLQTALIALEGQGKQTNGIVEQVAMARQEVATAAHHDARLQEAEEMLDTAQVHVQEAVRTLQQYLNNIEIDSEKLNEVDNRLIEIRSLTRKYGPSIEQVLKHLENCQTEYHSLLHHDELTTELTYQLEQQEKLLVEASETLHNTRCLVAEKLSAQVEHILRQLNMPSAILHVLVERNETDHQVTYSEHGIDTVTFLFTANKGEDPKPLHKIASGGELSRTLLALKSVLATVDELETLIFDEIDTGVSGTATERIAEQLLHLGQMRQVLCVTHSAQIAAAGHHHFVIEKIETESDTTTHVHEMNLQERKAEIARLLGSSLSDETAHEHALALLESFQNHCTSTG